MIFDWDRVLRWLRRLPRIDRFFCSKGELETYADEFNRLVSQEAAVEDGPEDGHAG